MSTRTSGRVGPHPGRGDITAVLALFVYSAAGSVFSSFILDQHRSIWPTMLLSAVGCGALLLRRSHPRGVLAVTALCAVVEGSLGYLLSPLLQGPLIAALYSLGLVIDRKSTRVYALLTTALVVTTAVLADPINYDLFLTAVNPIAWVLLPAVLGSMVQLRRAYIAAVQARAEHAERTREEEAQHRVAQERMRIARELHDVVAHHLALANAQAGTVAHLLRVNSDQASLMLDSLRETTAEALREMKATVGLLRQDNDSDALGPAPGLAQLEELRTAFGTAGLSVQLSIAGESVPLPTGADLNAYRIVQEALTNVTKHAATATAHVDVAYSAAHVTLKITNEGTVIAGGPPSGKGFGLVGMRERAHSAGGTLHAGPTPHGGFEVTCTLPLPPRHQREESRNP
ncbi:sensor histidine kinase [Streptomyces sp. NPDC056244]|uniref:sensor histidine kinase n=1 Tax=Streptomyces sp. NPDC056244 TaxID=3345762 RepID=UPI0035D8739F